MLTKYKMSHDINVSFSLLFELYQMKSYNAINKNYALNTHTLYCPRRDFASESRGGTLVARPYIKDSVCMTSPTRQKLF